MKFDSSSCTNWAVSELEQSGWDGTSPLLGIAPINPFWWPVKPSLTKWIRSKITGNDFLQFQLWYFFSWSQQRDQQFENYLDAIASVVNEFVKKHMCHVAIFGMERLDADACSKLKSKLNIPASVFLSADYNGYQMAAGLRQMSWLVTSRYRAEVLSMDAQVPCVAVSMDERLDNIMQEMGMDHDQLLAADDPNLSSELPRDLEYICSHQEQIKNTAGQQLVHYQNTLDEMGDFLTKWLRSYGDAAA